MQINTG